MSEQYGYKSTGFKSSKEMAQKLRDIAEFLEDHEDFPVDFFGASVSAATGKLNLTYFEKPKFIEAVKAIGSAAKSYTEGDYSKLVISSNYAPIELSISRDKVCTKKVVYDCEPLFSAEEVEAL